MKALKKWAQFALELASPCAPYVEVRALKEQKERLAQKNGKLKAPLASSKRGLAIRIWNRGWGFAATSVLNQEGIRTAISLAKQIASDPKAQLAPASEVQGTWHGPCEFDPFVLSMQTKLELLAETEGQLQQKQIASSEAAFMFEGEEQFYLNSCGAQIIQTKTTAGYSLRVIATDGTQTMIRSYPNCLGGGFRLAGFEYLLHENLPQKAKNLAEEAKALLAAPPAPEGEMDLILGGNQLALQLHETFGHALELDRALGTEESLAGGSFLTPDKLGLQVASELVNVTADSTGEGAGSFGYDAEGMAAGKLELIRAGNIAGYLGSREHNLSQNSLAAMRFASWSDLPLVRMTNINLEPGEATVEELIGGIQRGILIETPNAWSIDEMREHFQFGAEMGYLIEGGKIQNLVQSPTYRGSTCQLWSRCDGVSNSASWETVPNCGKGLPVQVLKVGHKVPKARFRDIAVGYGGRR